MDCRICGAHLAPGAWRCWACGAGQASGGATAPAGQEAPFRRVAPGGDAAECGRHRPVALVGLLSLLTFSLYAVYWLFATWRELRAVHAADGRSPAAHALAIAILPIYGLFRLHTHLRAVADVAEEQGVARGFSPGLCVLLVGVSTHVLRLAYRAAGEGPFLDWGLLPFFIEAGVVMWAQGALNRAWQARSPGPAAFRIHPGEFAALAIGAVLWLSAGLWQIGESLLGWTVE